MPRIIEGVGPWRMNQGLEGQRLVDVLLGDGWDLQEESEGLRQVRGLDQVLSLLQILFMGV
jgi:hypothetical protein